ncbi:WD40 repeat-like protein [Trichoderma sp. SZMC 28015]
MTWAHKHSLEFFWPLRFLPLEPRINEARILTFGYNGKFRPGSGKSKMSILDFAKDLLYDLKYAQDESTPEHQNLRMGERPIIFLVHSMGGLIVKEAYIQGQYDPTYETIIKAVSAIVFLSTPHRGTNLAETLNRILQVSFGANPMQFIAELAAGSQTLQRLNEQFRHVAPKLQIVSFYETRPTTILKKTQIMVLDKDSSVLGYPGEISKPLDADHNGICKYASPADPKYITVINVLKTLIGKGKSKESATSTDVMKPPIANFNEHLSVFESPDGDYNFFHDRWMPGTCNWIVSHEAFVGWMNDLQLRPRVLWINGNAASGKSILSSFVINHLAQHELPCQYFFIRFNSPVKRMISMILRSLACQVANSVPEYAAELRKLIAAATDLKTADYRNLWQWLFSQSLLQLDLSSPIYWVLDGVDEAEQPASVIKLLSELRLTTIPLRVLVVSRKTHEISSAFQKLAKRVHMETICMEGNLMDFRSYIDQEMDLAGDATYKENITAQLLERAKGNFLWVHLAVQKINLCYTKLDVKNALMELPSGMEALYDRMASSVQSQKSAGDRRLGQSILNWATCARRLLSVEELGDALGNDGLLEIHRAVSDLCGGFVIVDHEGKVTMIHETAREYLTKRCEEGRPLFIHRQSTNDVLFKRCIARLTDQTLRSQRNRNRPPALLDYAVSAWSSHLFLGSAVTPEILEILVSFLKSSHILTWIYMAAKGKKLGVLVTASRHLTEIALKLRKIGDEFVVHRQAAAVIEGWAADLVKVVGKFGSNLREQPDSIYKLIPPFCPEDSIIYQQFGKRESRAIHVSGITTTTWDDCLARFTLSEGVVASSVIAAGNRIFVLTMIRKTSQVIVYNANTFEEQRRVTHPERVLSIQANKLGNLLVSYGYATTRVWDINNGACVKTVKNPAKRPRPHSILFSEKPNKMLVCGEDRCTRSVSLNEGADDEWEIHSKIEEQSLDDTAVSFPICSALSPDGNMIVFGYRRHPATSWELEPARLVGQCYVPLKETDMTIEYNTCGEVFKLVWHPFSGEVFGLTQVGLLFRWNPYEEEANASIQAGAHSLTVSKDGSLIATGDAVGTIKIYATADFAVLYQLASQDPVLHLSFSIDSRRLYDIRGSYGNVWEPNSLVRLVDALDQNNDSCSETESLARASLLTEHHTARIDSVITLSGQSVGPLYCYGTEDGVAMLCEAGRGRVCELERLASYMSIEHVTWSEDGRLVALADLSGKLTIKKIVRSSENAVGWQVTSEFNIIIPQEQGHINQLLFHPTGRELFVSTPGAICSVDLASHVITRSTIKTTISGVKWAWHPTLADTLLGFGTFAVYIFSWMKLQELEVHSYSPPRLGSSVNITLPSFSHGHAGSFQKDTETLGRMISSLDSSQVLLEILPPGASGRIESQYLLFDLDDLQLGSSEEESSQGSQVLPYTLIPIEIASCIRQPLAFLSRSRLVFLNVERWICTWRLPSWTGKASESSTKAIERYYFLPGDWATSDEARLCTITPDGTLLCPRNGDIAVVQAAKLRR